MNLQLYYAPGACSFVPHVMLEQSGLVYEPKLIKLHKGEQRSDAFLAMNPRGQVPVLVIDGQVVTQIVAIVDAIDQLSPSSGFIPRDPIARAKWMETLAWMNNTVHPTFTRIFMPEKFTDDAAAQAAIKAHALGSYRQWLTELQGLLAAGPSASQRDWGGSAVGPLDAYALTLLRWGSIAGINPDGFPALWAHVQQVAQDPAVARVIECERLTLNLYKPA